MKMTRERKIFAGVLAVSLGWFGYDRMTASPAEAADSGSLLLASGQSSNKLPSNEPEEVSLAERLSALAKSSGPTNPDQLRDIFKPASSWAQRVASGVDSADRPSPDRFAQIHKLSTVSVGKQGEGVAVVDGRMLHVGAMLDGYKLLSVSRNSAQFDAGNGVQVKLAVGR